MNEFMAIAVEEAKKGVRKGHGGPFGAVVVKDGKIISQDHNRVLKKSDPTSHAEMNAIRKACHRLHSFDLSGCELYTTAEPCPMCFCGAEWANIKKIFYGCSVEDTARLGFRDRKFYGVTEEKRDRLMKEIDKEECKEVFKQFLASDKKNIY